MREYGDKIRGVEIRIEPMELRHLDEVMEIELYSFPTPWERRMYEMDIAENERSRFYVALANSGLASQPPALSAFTNARRDEVAGYIGNWFIIDECHVGTIAVGRDYRGLGIAKLLLGHTAEKALAESVNHIILEVRVGNEAAISLYLSLGFKKVGRRKGYYQDTGEDAHLMMATNLADIAARFSSGGTGAPGVRVL